MPTILKGVLSAIVNGRKALVWILTAILLAIVIAVHWFRRALFNLLGWITAAHIGTAILLVASSIFLILLLWQFPRWQVRSIIGLDSKDRFNLENEARKTLSQILGGLILLAGFYFTWQNLVVTRQNQAEAEKASQENFRIASEGQITDRFTKAVAQLGDSRFEVWLGGVYALERIARDSPRDHWSIMEILTSYIREHARLSRKTKASLTTQPVLQKSVPDIQAILTVIGRRNLTYQKGEEQRLDLHETDLAWVDLEDGNLSGADLRGTNLVRANLSSADLRDANLRGAFLIGADLSDAYLANTNLSEANFSGADLTGAHLAKAVLVGAHLTGAHLDEADLSGANLNRAFLDFYTNLTGAHLMGARLSGAILNLASLAQADLRGADLKWADLTGADLNEATLKGANLGGANLDGSDFSNADLTETIGLSPEQLKLTKGNAQTKLPPNTPRPKSWQQ
jgi:uncharacterized protein YjbI with pentapeptide repeats